VNIAMLGGGERRPALPRGPFLHHQAQVVQVLDGGFEVAADLRPVFSWSLGQLGDGDHAAVVPCAGGDGNDGFIEIGGPQLQFLATCAFWPKNRALAYVAGVCIGQQDAESEVLRAHDEKGIRPPRGFVDIDIKALGGQRNLLKLCAVQVELAFFGLCLLFGFNRVLRYSFNGALFFAASQKSDGKQQPDGGESIDFCAETHVFKDIRTSGSG